MSRRNHHKPRRFNPAPRVIAKTALEIFTDGAAEPNPGAAGWSFVVFRDSQEIAYDCGGFEHATNNQAELTGLLRALEWIGANAAGEVATVWSDSTYCVNGATSWRFGWRLRGWTRKGSGELANVDLWKEIDSALTTIPLITVAWCRGHSGIPGNERADELASIGRTSISPDAGFLTTDIGALDREYRAIMGGST